MEKEWQQKEFMLSGFMMTWHIDREAMDTYAALLKEAGIDLLIPYAASPLDFPMHRLYEACEKNNIQILTGIREIVTDEEGKPKAKGITYQPTEVDEEKIRREVAALREKYPKALAGHYLWDEPGMRLQMNGALAYGVQGVLIFTANECIITNDIEKSEKFDDMAVLNQQTRNIGNLLLSAEREAVYHNTGYKDYAAAYIDDLSLSEIIAEAPVWGPGLIASLFRDGDTRYLVLVSKNYMRAVSGTITLKESYRVAAYDADTDTFAETGETVSVPYELEAGGIAVYRLS